MNKPDQNVSEFTPQLNLELSRLQTSASKLVSLLAAVLVPLFYLSGIDFLFSPEHHIHFLFIRICVGFLGLIFFLLLRNRKTHTHANWFSIAIAIIVGGAIAIMIRFLGADSPYYAGLNLVYLAMILIPWRVTWTIVTCSIIFGAYLIPALIFDAGKVPATMLISNAQFQISTIIIAIVASQYLYRTRCNEILSRLQIQKQSEELKLKEEQKRVFISGISHDLKSPISVISGHIDLILKNGNLSPENIYNINYITMHLGKVSLLLDSLINSALSGKVDETPVFEPYSLTLLAQNFCTPFDAEARKHEINLHLEIPQEKMVVLGDGMWFERILGNLIQNAFKFTPAGGTITVRLERDAHTALIEVADTGCGIAEEKLPYIFERRFQARESDKAIGFGLGLSIVFDMIKRMSGTITVSSAVGRGTTFRISLPLAVDQTVRVVNREYTGPERRGSGSGDRRSGQDRRAESRLKYYLEQVNQDYSARQLNINPDEFENRAPGKPTILVAEDTLAQVNLLVECLHPDFNLYFAENGKIALEKLQKLGSRVDLILSDVNMPEMNGMEFCRHVFEQEAFRQVPFIFLTAYANEYEQLEGIKLGATDYLQKPFNRDILREKFNHWLAIRKHERLLGQAIEELDGRNKELGKLRSIIAHEIRNPLQVLHGHDYYITKLREQFFEQSNEKLKKYWNNLNIADTTKSIAAILDSAKTIEAEMNLSSMKPTPVGELTTPALEQTRELTYQMQLNTTCTIDPATLVNCDIRLITQVLVNLIRNATEAIIECRNREEGRIDITISKKEDHVSIEVRDNGAGIKPEFMEKLFGYLHTSKKEGTGIGLYLSKKIMRLHGGDLYVESEVGKGSNFILNLSLVEEIRVDSTESVGTP